MGRALAAGWLANGRAPETIAVVDPSEAAQVAANSLGLVVAHKVPSADVCVLAIKPAQLDSALDGIDHKPNQLYLSIVAGRKVSSIAARIAKDAAIVRAMPNTPAAVGRGITAMCASASVTDTQTSVCTELMSAVGQALWIDDESLMDAVTAISGSGPAYVFLLIECLASAGRELGLDAALAEKLATETVAGSGAYASAAAADAAELRRRVTSPNGTTQAALEVLMADDGLAALIRNAVIAAAKRSAELSNSR
jgi:pyrroline-5-carboxylate reductase